MNYCGSCGQQIPEGTSVCPECGNNIAGLNTNEIAALPDSSEKISAALSHSGIIVGVILAAFLSAFALIGFLFMPLFIYIFSDARHSFAKSHALAAVKNTIVFGIFGLTVYLINIAIVKKNGILGSFMAAFTNTYFELGQGLAGLLLFTLMVIGIIQALRGKEYKYFVFGNGNLPVKVIYGAIIFITLIYGANLAYF